MKNVKGLNTIIFAFVIVALSTTVVVILTINLKLWQENLFSFTIDGLLNYFKAYGDFKDLFVVTIAATAAYVALQSLQETVQANRERLKQERFNEWKGKMDIRLLEGEENNQRLRLVYMELRLKYFDWLDRNNFIIGSKTELALVFLIFKPVVQSLEDQNEIAIKMGQVYPDAKYSYSYDGFRFMFIGGPDTTYAEFETDLNELYIDQLRKERVMSLKLYQAARLNMFPNLI